MKQLHGARMVLKNGDPIEALRFNSESSALDSRTGEFNASSKKDLANQISKLMAAFASGEITEQPAKVQTREQIMADRREYLATAMNNKDEWAALGASIANQVREQADREGFLRAVSMSNTLRQGEIARVPMPAHDSVAVIATSSANVGYQIIRQRMFNPDEFEIIANVRVEALDIEQVSGDILDHAYNDALQAIMVAEDRLWKKAADATVGMVNPLEYIAGDLSPRSLGNLRNAVSGWNLPATRAIISNDYWSDVTGSNDFATFLDPISKYDLVMTGRLGTLVGLELLTDAFRQPNLKVLNPGEIYVISDKENHAAYSTRGGVRSTPTDGADSGNSTKGWFMSEFFSFVLPNARSVAKGVRV